MKKLVITAAVVLTSFSAALAENVSVTVHADQGKDKINKEIYGQFSEHLGSCIYGGLWVGENSKIPNINGYRKDVFEALKALKIPVMRWPGGCFADDYHWMDGIGPQEQRAYISNNNWGGTLEDNSFGTHEFLNLCEKLGCEPYISGNVGSGSVEEMAKWVEYMTSDAKSTMADLRRANGREEPWKVKYFGVGNEAWGCGGNMTAQYYGDVYRRYATYLRNYGGNLYFDLRTPNGVLYDLQLTGAPLYNVENAVAATAVAMFAGASENEIRFGLAGYAGVRRRFDVRFKNADLVFIDDYAHHPEEIKACLRSVRDFYPGRTVTVMFQPHLYSRTRDFANEFAAALDMADRVIITDIYPARELPIEGVSSEMILERMKLKDKMFCPFSKLKDEAVKIKSGVLLTMGAGNIDTLIEPIHHAMIK